LNRTSTVAGKQARQRTDRQDALLPIRLALSVTVMVSLLVPVLPPASSLVVLLIVGMPAYRALFASAWALLSTAAHRPSPGILRRRVVRSQPPEEQCVCPGPQPRM